MSSTLNPITCIVIISTVMPMLTVLIIFIGVPSGGIPSSIKKGNFHDDNFVNRIYLGRD